MSKKIFCGLFVFAMMFVLATVASAGNDKKAAPANEAIVIGAGFHCNHGIGNGNGSVKIAGIDNKTSVKIVRVGDSNTWQLVSPEAVCPACSGKVWYSFSNNSGVPNGKNMQFECQGSVADDDGDDDDGDDDDTMQELSIEEPLWVFQAFCLGNDGTPYAVCNQGWDGESSDSIDWDYVLDCYDRWDECFGSCVNAGEIAAAIRAGQVEKWVYVNTWGDYDDRFLANKPEIQFNTGNFASYYECPLEDGSWYRAYQFQLLPILKEGIVINQSLKYEDLDDVEQSYCRYRAYVKLWNDLDQKSGHSLRMHSEFLDGALYHYYALCAEFGMDCPPYWHFGFDNIGIYDYWADQLEPGLIFVLGWTDDELFEYVLDFFAEENLGLFQ